MDKSDKLSFRLVQKGDKIIAKKENPNAEFNPRQILDQLDALVGAIDAGKAQIVKSEETIKDALANLEINEGMKKKFIHFKDWADKIQRSKVKAIIEENKAVAQKTVEETYKDDVVLSKEQNLQQKFMRYQHTLSVHPRIAEEINSKIMKDMFYNNCVLENPFKG